MFNFLRTALASGVALIQWLLVQVPYGLKEQRFPNPVFPGDDMFAVIALLDANASPGSPMNWVILLENKTQKWQVQKTVTYAGNLQSVEWIEEAPTWCGPFSCSVTDLADYDSVTFDPDTYMPPGLGFGGAITMVQNGNVVSTPSDPDGDQDGLTVAYGAAKPDPPLPFITSTSLPDAYLNVPYKAHIFLVGQSSYQWSASNLPAWLTLDKNTGDLSGTPSALGRNDFSVVATDVANSNISTQIQPLSVTVTGIPNPDFTLSANPVNIQLHASPTAGCSGSSTITVNPLFGFTGDVQLSGLDCCAPSYLLRRWGALPPPNLISPRPSPGLSALHGG
jgi:hypothetical protein